MKKYHLLAITLALLCLPHAHAQVYKWKDEKGVTHYGDDPRAAGKGAAAIKSAPASASGSAPAAPIPSDKNEAPKLGDAYDFNRLPAATIGQCLGYARQIVNADPRFSRPAIANIPELQRRIELTCPGVGFTCHTYIGKSHENFCQPGLRSQQTKLVEHQAFDCSACAK